MAGDVMEDARRVRDELGKRLHTEVRTRKSAATKRRIMQTAEEIISERGNTVFKMSEVSRRCGMSKGALYYYFTDKQDLVNAVFEDQVEELLRLLDNTVAQADSAGEALRLMCDTFVNRVSGSSPLAMALVRDLALIREPGSYAQNVRVRHIVGLIADQLERGKEEGIVRPDVDARFAAVGVCGMFTFSAVSMSERQSGGGNPADKRPDGGKGATGSDVSGAPGDGTPIPEATGDDANKLYTMVFRGLGPE